MNRKRKEFHTNYKDSLKKVFPKSITSNGGLSSVQNHDRDRKVKPTSYKVALKKTNAQPAVGNTPAYVTKLRLQYQKEGKLSNAHKKFLNMVSNQRVSRKGCKSCGIKINNNAL